MISALALLASVFCLASLSLPNAKAEGELIKGPENLSVIRTSTGLFSHLITDYHGDRIPWTASADQNGIKEEIPSKYQSRYQRWKKEFLSTEMGRKEWNLYAYHARFSLTLAISSDNAKGASTGDYKWDAAGRLIAARIVLGSNLDDGFPNPIYFPVMNSLELAESTDEINGDTLAATKIAHEFGHVKSMASGMNASLYRLQMQLIPQYNNIFLSNGRNINDPRLLELARQIGGTPVEIWEDREYWGETNAMLYIRDKFDESLRCSLFSRIKRSLDLYAKTYEARFIKIAQSVPSVNRCAW